MKRIGMVSLGCPKNLDDSEVMMGVLRRHGFELTPDPAEAEVVVVNTCGFIDAAKQESVDAVLEMARHKQDGSCRRLIVTGCLAERYRDELRREIPEIDAVLGTGDVPAIVGAIHGAPAAAHPLPLYRGVTARSPVRPEVFTYASSPSVATTSRTSRATSRTSSKPRRCSSGSSPALSRPE